VFLRPGVDALGRETPAVLDRARRSIERAIAKHKPAVVLLPAGIGRHRDHLVTREIGRQAAERMAVSIAFYEDLPYARRLPLRKLLDHFAMLSPDLYRLHIPVADGFVAKRAAVEVYRSQVDARLIRTLAKSASPAEPCERIWSSAPASMLMTLPLV
jgi:LmbE family N-acetylglucosaminyl deacetylase